MSDYDIHSCGYYCDRHACILRQRDELRDKLFSDQAVKTYSGGKPNYTQPIEREPILSGGSGSTHFIHMHNGWRFLKKDEPVIDKSMCEPKREWVGLTLQEIDYIEGMTLDKHDAIRMAAVALQEKNGG
jgi:hypothetical protein